MLDACWSSGMAACPRSLLRELRMNLMAEKPPPSKVASLSPAFIDVRRQFVDRWRHPEGRSLCARRISNAQRAAVLEHQEAGRLGGCKAAPPDRHALQPRLCHWLPVER